MATRRRVVVRAPRMRRETSWGGLAAPSSRTAVAGSTNVLYSQIVSPVGASGFTTLIRTIGQLWVFSDQSTTTEFFSGAMGFAVVADSARAAGAASLPDPAVDVDDDLWFGHSFFAGEFLFKDATGTQLNGYRYDFDFRSQRKVEEGRAIVQMIKCATAQGISVWSAWRMLFKLS